MTHSVASAIAVLSTGTFINSSVFDYIDDDKRGPMLDAAPSPFRFFKNFEQLFDKDYVLLSIATNHADAQALLELNNITLGEEDARVLAQFQDLMKRLKDRLTVYNWTNAEPKGRFVFQEKRLSRNGYTCGHATFRKIWETASLFWSGGPEPDTMGVRAHGDHRHVEFYRDRIEIGCQNIPRGDVEYVAQQLNLEPNIHRGE